MALVDARFLQWLQGEATEAAATSDAEPVKPRSGVLVGAWDRTRLAGALNRALLEGGVHARVKRVFWYASELPEVAVNGEVVRLVPPEAADSGAGLILAMARDALQLAEQRACSHLLIASDDDRLLATVDAVQMRGLTVHLLADRSALDLPALEQSDPSWASLLRQADARLVLAELPAMAPERRTRREAGYDGSERNAFRARLASGAEAWPADVEAIGPCVKAWLQGLETSTRLDLQAQLPGQRGLPQEADRALLQLLSHRLGRPLAVPERKLMRELARAGLMAAGEAPEAELEH